MSGPTNGVPILGQGAATNPGDPMYYVLIQWMCASAGQAGPMEIMAYAPKLHGRPSEFGPPHVMHIKEMVKAELAKQGMIGVEVVIQFMWRYETQPSAAVDLHRAPSPN